MSKIKPEHAFSTECFQGFGGIRNDLSGSAKGAADLRNFRILPDGSLEKRGGWDAHFDFASPCRGMWEGDLSGTRYIFGVFGSCIYRVNPANDACTMITALDTSGGDVCFLAYAGDLYLSDGEDIYRYNATADEFLSAVGYIPLFGKNWHPTDYGSTYEEENLLTSRLRVNYLNTVSSTVFMLPYYTEEIDAVYVNGHRIYSYSFTPYTDSFTIPAADTGTRVDVVFRVAQSDTERTRLVRTLRGFVDMEKENEVMLRFDGPLPYRLYRSAPVSDFNYSDCHAYFPSCDRLYFRASDILTVGDSDHPIRAMVRHGGRLLAFTSLTTYALGLPESGEGDASVLPLSTGIGCTSPHGLLPCGNDLLAVNIDGIFRLRASSSATDSYYAEKISDPVAGLLSDGFAENAIARYDPVHGEYWFRDRTETTSGLVLVWKPGSPNRWYLFDGLLAEGFLDLPTYRGFWNEGTVCRLSDGCTLDGTTQITASYRSDYLSFSHPEAVKRALRFLLCARTGGASVQLTFDTESTTKQLTLSGSVGTPPELFDRRLRLGRFRFLRFRILVTGTARCRIYSATFYANL